MLRRRNVGFIAICWLALGPVALAQNDILKAIPADALGFAIVNNLEGTNDKLDKAVQALRAPMPFSLLPMAKITTGIQDGLNDKGTAAVVAMPSATGIPEGVLLLPTTDFKALVAGLQPDNADAPIVNATITNQPISAAKKGNFAALAKRDSPALKQLLEAKTDVAGATQQIGGWLGTQNVAVVLTNSGVKLSLAGASTGLAQARRALVQLPDPQAQESIRNTFDLLDAALSAAQTEVHQLAVGVRIDDAGHIHVGSFTAFVSGGKAAGLLAGAKPNQGNLLAGLPTGSYVLAFGSLMPDKLPEGLVDLTIKLSKANPAFAGLKEDELRAMMAESFASAKGMKSMAMVMGVPQPGQSLYAAMAAVTKMADAKKYMAEYPKTIERMAKLYEKTPLGLKMEHKGLKIGDVDAFEFTMDMSGQFANTPPQAKAILDTLLGPNGKLSAYVGAVDPQTIVMAYVSQENFQRAVAAAKATGGGLASDSAVGQTAQLLPVGSQVVVYLSPQGTVEMVKSMIVAFAPPGQALSNIPAFPATPPIGGALKLAPGGVETDLVLPAATLEGIAKFVFDVRNALQ